MNLHRVHCHRHSALTIEPRGAIVFHKVCIKAWYDKFVCTSKVVNPANPAICQSRNCATSDDVV